jgi:hypothetical protein
MTQLSKDDAHMPNLLVPEHNNSTIQICEFLSAIMIANVDFLQERDAVSILLCQRRCRIVSAASGFSLHRWFFHQHKSDRQYEIITLMAHKEREDIKVLWYKVYHHRI